MRALLILVLFIVSFILVISITSAASCAGIGQEVNRSILTPMGALLPGETVPQHIESTLPLICCEGLTPRYITYKEISGRNCASVPANQIIKIISGDYSNYDALCVVPQDDSKVFCTACGNNVCDQDYENKYNCPSDCNTQITPKSYCSGDSCILYETNNLILSFGTISIGFIQPGEVILSINNIRTNKLSTQYNTFENDLLKITINNIVYDAKFGVDTYANITVESKRPSIPSSSCENQICNLYNGQRVIVEGKDVSIGFVSSKELKLKVGDTLTRNLNTGDSIEFDNTRISIIKSNYVSKNDLESYVLFNYSKLVSSSCGSETTPYLSLKEGESSTFVVYGEQYLVSSPSIFSNAAKLVVNNVALPSLGVEDIYRLNDGVTIIIKEICADGKVVEIYNLPKEVRFMITSSENNSTKQDKPNTSVQCVNGCLSVNKKICHIEGFRSGNTYCDLTSHSFIDQKSAESSCDNNFQCSSNVCVSNKCLNSSLLDKIINWFKRLFGGK